MNEPEDRKVEFGLGNTCSFYFYMVYVDGMEIHLARGKVSFCCQKGIRQIRCRLGECFGRMMDGIRSFWAYQARVVVIQPFINECS